MKLLETLIFVSIFILIISGMPRFVIKRSVFLYKLKKKCKNKKFNFKVLQNTLLFSNIKGKKFDFYIETSKLSIYVKLCGEYSKRNYVRLIDEVQYGVKKLHFQPFQNFNLSIDFKDKVHPNYAFPNECKLKTGKQTVLIMLFLPMPGVLLINQEEVQGGDTIGKYRVHSARSFIDYINLIE